MGLRYRLAVGIAGAGAILAVFLPLRQTDGTARADARAENAVPDIRTLVREVRAETIERTVRKLVSFGTRNTLSSQTNPTRGIGAARDWLLAEFKKVSSENGGRLVVTAQTFEQAAGRRIPNPIPLTNVLAMLPGTLPNPEKRLYVVSGHYDSIPTNPLDTESDAPGANDDASGTAAVLEIARVLSTKRFDYPILFACVAGEEQGLYGSTYLAEQLKKDGWQVEGMFTNDIIGGTTGGNGVIDRRSVRVFSEGVPSDETAAQAALRRSVGGENDAPSRQLARFVKETGERFVSGFRVQLIARRDRYGRGGDHIPFNERGISALRFTEPNEDYHHQHQNVRTENGVVYGDLPEFVDFAYVAQVARVNLAALASLALAPAAPRETVIATGRLTSDTELRWKANAEPDLAGYEIVWRDTMSPLWQKSLRVGSVTSFVMKGLSKDNVFFGVRALDREGHRSPVAYPRPGR